MTNMLNLLQSLTVDVVTKMLHAARKSCWITLQTTTGVSLHRHPAIIQVDVHVASP